MCPRDVMDWNIECVKEEIIEEISDYCVVMV